MSVTKSVAAMLLLSGGLPSAAGLLPTGTASAQEAQQQGPAELRTVEAAGVKVHFLAMPWGPETFGAMERGDESYYNRRSWPFARLESRVPLSLDGTPVAAGNYALVFHPNTADKKGMSLELRKIAMPEFLQPGNVMTPTPEGETVYKAPVTFTSAPETVPALSLSLAEAKTKGTLTLEVRYGNRRLTKDLKLTS
jgi:hypothetical protein